MNKIYKFYSIVLLFVMSLFCVLSVDGTKVEAASYDSYYTNVDTSSGQKLISSLRTIISTGAKDIGYDGVWDAYYTTDIKPGTTNIIWDMYSNENYKVGTDQAGNYKVEGDKYNREHSVPKSWFDDARPMHNDLFHVYPTDGFVNGKRSNYPFGETDSPEYTSHNGSKLGSSSFSGYSGKVFEPIDEYKGDFARTYFYMATRYNSEGKNTFSYENGPVVFKSSYPFLTSYATNLFVKWHLEDPVSEKETNRNDAVYAIQKNRNPYIDHPEYVNDIWGGEYEAPTPTPSTYTVTYSVGSGVTFSYSDNTKYTSGSLISKPNVNPTKTGFEFVGWTANTNTRELWDFNTNKITKNTTLYPLFKASSPDAFTNDVSAVKTQLLANYTSTTTETGEVVASGYKKVTNASELSVGDKIIIVNDSKKLAMSTAQNKNNRGVASVEISAGVINTLSSDVEVITLENGSSTGTFALKVNTGYLYAASSGDNWLRTQSDINANSSYKINITSGSASIVAQGSNTRNTIMYNNSANIFSSYASGQQAVSIYKETSGAGTVTTYEPTDVAIKFNYYVSTDIYNAFVDDYDFAFEYDSSYITDVFFESVTYNGQKCVKVSVIFDNITDYTKTYSVKPVLVKKEDNTQKAYGTQSTSYSVKSLAEYYLNNASNDATVKKYQSLLDYIAD